MLAFFDGLIIMKTNGWIRRQMSGVESTHTMFIWKPRTNNSLYESRRKISQQWSRIAMSIVAVVAIFATVLVGLRIAGFRTFTVMSGSMEPELPVGSLIYIRPVNYYDLKVGDVISFVANKENTVVTHRIVEIEVDENDDSVWRFKTKGDANAAADAQMVHCKNVLGTPIMTIPQIGYIAYYLQKPPGIYIALIVAVLLLAWTFLPETLEGRRRKIAKESAL